MDSGSCSSAGMGEVGLPVHSINECGICGRKNGAVIASSPTSSVVDEFTNISLTPNSDGLPESKPIDIESEEDNNFWIQCDGCDHWLHGR